MLLRGFVVLKIILLNALATNGQTNPFFICQARRHHETTMDTYVVAINQRDEIVISNCTNSLINDIIDRIHRSSLRGRPVHLNIAPARLNEIRLDNLISLDISRNDLAEVNLEQFEHLKYLNLTSNKLRSIEMVKLHRNITLKSLDLSKNRLLKLEHLSIPQTQRLYVRSNNIFDLDANVTLPSSLLELDLTRNEIENISATSFVSKHLKVLNLSVNLINAISRATFKRLPSLETLILQCNKILEIEAGTFAGNVKLVELSIRDNNLSVLKKGVFDDLVNLQALDISKNGLLRLTPDTVQNLNNLVHFSLSENLKLCTAECKRDLEFLLVLDGRLKVLKMNRLRLRHFPVTLTTSIRHLDLSRNKLTSVQLGDLENFPFLETLTLNDNEIETTEKDVFSRMEYLSELYLDNNRLKRVPGGLPLSLKTLHLNGNRISAINKSDFNNLINLRVLKLNSNSICSVESGAFRYLRDLELMDISHNPILRLSTDAFEGPGKMKTLDASALANVHINVTDLRYFPISEMPNLRHLNLSRSPPMVQSFLTDLPLLATVKQLETLDLSYANLTRVPSRLENLLPRLKQLILLGNPLNCSDLWWREWTQPYVMDARQIAVDEAATLTVRIGEQSTQPGSNLVISDDRCATGISVYTTVSSDWFWASLLESNSTVARSSGPDLSSDSKHAAGRSFVAGNSTSSKVARQPLADANSNSSESTISGRDAIKSTAKRKKLNSRSLSVSEAANTASAELDSTRAKSIKLEPVPGGSQTPLSNATGKETTVTTATATYTPHSTIRSFNITASVFSTDAMSARIGRSTKRSLLNGSVNPLDAELATELPYVSSTSIGRYANVTSDSASPPRSTNAWWSSSHPLLQPTPTVHAPLAMRWNRSEDQASFFDWFPASNQSSDPAERIATLEDTAIEYTHPGLVIFVVISCLLAVGFVSLVAPSCTQKYRWTRHRYRTSEFDNECQRSIEISSISAFVETEITAE